VIVASLLAITVLLVLVTGGLAALAVAVNLLGMERPTRLAVGLVLFACLLIAIALDVRYLRRWVDGFYTANLSRVMWLFIVISFPAIALGMGVPITNVVLGTLAGLYVGRRHLHAGDPPKLLRQAARSVARFTGAVVVALSFPMGMLALYGGEAGIAREMVTAIGLQYDQSRGIGFVVVLCGVLYGVQYWLARAGAVLGGRGSRRAPDDR